MEKKKSTGFSSSSTIADELFERKDVAKPSPSGFFGSVFPAPSSSPDVFGPSRKHLAEGQTRSSHTKTADGNSNVSPNKVQNISNKDRYSDEAINACNLSSSLYYGGQDICSNISSAQTHGSQYTNTENAEDDPNDSDMASRGNWWQGSLYY